MKLLLSIIILTFLISCEEHSESKISQLIEQKCNGKDCVIDMKNIVNEDWDYMYVFTVGMSLEQINAELGFKYNAYWEDIANRVIFVKNNKVVYHEDEFPNPEKLKKGELIFLLDNSDLFKIPKKEAIFNVQITNDCYYLSQKK